jgi:hypothetical protein
MKVWYKSRTLWLNIASIVTTLATLALGQLQLLGLPDGQLFWWMLILTLVVNVGNIVLRFDTTEKIGKPSDEFKGEHG